VGKNIIEPRVLKGFRDFLPDQEMRRKKIENILIETFESYGFVPIDTPILEYTDVLLGKGGGETDKQVYRFTDHGDRDVAMRFDLTVPFARYMASHRQELYTPFRRYHIGKVWRGENTQRGRYREFAQCDFDIVGTDSISADFEILLLMKRSLEALGVSRLKIHVSDRNLFTAFLKNLGLAEHSVEILRSVDKLQKIGKEEVVSLLSEYTELSAAEKIVDFITPEEDWHQTMDKCRRLLGGDSRAADRLDFIYQLIRDLNIEETFYFDPSITRGLDYYTGTVFETFLTDYREIGSVCSGGRYDNLTSLYIKEQLPGVGSSIGIDRLITALEHLGVTDFAQPSVGVLIFCLDPGYISYYHQIAEQLRNKGLTAEVYPEKKKLGQQFQYAEKKGIPCGIFCGEDERQTDTVNVKDLITRESFDKITVEKGIEKIMEIVSKHETA
jgi:histidyl-tRNA synthetase